MNRRFTVDHPVDESLTAACGFDPFCGFFAEISNVRKNRPHLIYDKLQRGYNHERPMLGALQFLEAHGFIADLEDALAAMEDPEPDKLPPSVQRSVEIVMQFKRAAD